MMIMIEFLSDISGPTAISILHNDYTYVFAKQNRRCFLWYQKHEIPRASSVVTCFLQIYIIQRRIKIFYIFKTRSKINWYT